MSVSRPQKNGGKAHSRLGISLLAHELPQEVVVVVVEMKKTLTCRRNDDCGWGSVGAVLLVGALVVPKIALTAS